MSNVSTSLAIVTGANKGIGFFIAQKLFESGRFSHVFLTARNPELGHAAVEKIRRESKPSSSSSSSNSTSQLEFHQLDVTDPSSVQRFSNDVRQRFLSSSPESGGGGGGAGKPIRVLVNNAGFAFKNSATDPFPDQARFTNDINFYGTLRITDALLPLIADGGSVVNVSSRIGLLEKLKEDALRNEFQREDLSVERLKELVEQFVDAAKEGKHQERGWPNSAYCVSKVAMTALSNIVARQNPTLRVNACCPGWCRTDMAGDKAPKSAEEGSDTPVWLALLEDEGTSGQFFAERKSISWFDAKPI